MLFQLKALRFWFVAREPIEFAKGTSSNILRGAFGTILRRLACVPECRGAKTCAMRAECSYARMFEPGAIWKGPSGLADWPRPFVFRAMNLDGRTFEAGETFWFDLNLFDREPETVEYLVRAFGELAREGLGPGRRKVELTKVTGGDTPLEFELEAVERTKKVRVRFVTPTELKSGHELVARPEFSVLAARLRDRISTLRELYGGGALVIDFRAFGDRAALVKMTRCQLRSIEARRKSSRTGQVHSLGGFVGEAEYEGDLGEFLPYLRVGQWTGVGRQTAWGKGVLEVNLALDGPSGTLHTQEV